MWPTSAVASRRYRSLERCHIGRGADRGQVERQRIQAAAFQGRLGRGKVAVPRLVGRTGAGNVEADLDDAVFGAEDALAHRNEPRGCWVLRRGGWYYLFFSGDNCCGPEAHYATMVARSRSATGP